LTHPRETATEPAATPEAPIYTKVRQDKPAGTAFWLISCDEGWRTSIVCCDMYEWAADWLLGVLGRQPYAPETRP
jgi:hypothetical protein